jgi:hypothetical protein
MPGTPGSPGSKPEQNASAGSEAPAERRPPWEKSGGDPGETSEGTPSDEVTLEDIERKKAEAAAAQASADAAAAQSEEAVLEDAVEAMKRKASEPSLEESQGGEATGSAASASAQGEAGQPGGAEPGSLEDIQQAVNGGGAGNEANGSESERLNAELNASLGRFEGAMLGERDRVQASAESTGSGASQAETASILEPGGGQGEEDTEGSYGSVREGPAPQQGKEGGASTANDSSSGSGMSTIGGGKGREGEYTHTAATNTPPPDIPDGSDDDVVARQIREAAMKEKDPELREKLWDEYRKYVNAAKRKS